MKAEMLDDSLRKEFRFKGTGFETSSRQPEVQSPEDLKKLVDKLRNFTDGMPIGVKIAAGKFLRRISTGLTSGADFIVVDGQKPLPRVSPILQDDFGIPTVFAIDRAAKWMEKHGFKDRISLIASGGIRTPVMP